MTAAAVKILTVSLQHAGVTLELNECDFGGVSIDKCVDVALGRRTGETKETQRSVKRESVRERVCV